MNSDTLDRIVGLIIKDNLDAMLIVSPENFAYMAGFIVPSHHILRWRHACIIVMPDRTVRAFVVDMEESTVKRRLPGIEVMSWREFADDSMAELTEALKALGLERARIGIELDYLPARDFTKLQGGLPNAVFVESQAHLNRLRQIKTPREIELMRRLSRISDQAIADAFAGVGEGSTEMDIAAGLTRSLYEQGGQDFRFMIVATGERSQLPNVGPTLRKLQAGDICRVEIFSIINGYHAGVCRTACVGEPPRIAKDIWKILSSATKELVSIIKPGVGCDHVYREYLRMVAPLNMPPIDFAGHGIGLHLHEDPYFAAADKMIVEANMVFGIEPLIYQTGHGFGMQNKDVISVTESGCELLSDVTDTTDLIIL